MTDRSDLKILPGIPYPMGVSKTSDGKFNFAAVLPAREVCGVLLYLGKNTDPVRLCFDEQSKVGNVYCLQVDGLNGRDFRYNFFADSEVITDPYAPVVHGNDRWGLKISPALSGGCMDEEFDWEGDRTLMTPLSDTILYLLHVRGFTRHASSGVEHKGTFRGIGEKIPYLVSLGITAVELMPAYEFMELERPVSRLASMDEAKSHYKDLPESEEHIKINYWGYKKGWYMAPKKSYSSGQDPVGEFRELVKALHGAGIELIMQFYFPADIRPLYILEVLRHWVLKYHVDGFHLMGVRIPAELTATDPVLGGTKLFYQEICCSQIYEDGEIPVYKNLAVYNDGFMRSMRSFLKSDEGSLQSALEALRRNPRQTGIINYITNYSGFTLADLVSYDKKHNEANGEENRDGENNNLSWNCGAEGKTRKKSVLLLRRRQMKNAMLLLLFAQGTPMIVSGDEFCFGREGNNNPYCQDNGTSWLNWNLAVTHSDFLNFVRDAVRLRRQHPILHWKEAFTMQDYMACGYPDMSCHGREAWQLDRDGSERQAGIMYSGRYAPMGEESWDNSFYIAYNMHWEERDFALPLLPENERWLPVFDTDENGTADQENEKSVLPADLMVMRLAGRSIRILKSVAIKEMPGMEQVQGQPGKRNSGSGPEWRRQKKQELTGHIEKRNGKAEK